MKERQSYIDIAKGIAIILVILGHNGLPDMVNIYIYTVHMPLFFILSGFFLKNEEIQDTVKKGWRRLIRPYLFTSMFILTFFVLYQAAKRNYDGLQLYDILISAVNGTIGPVWFLLSLFVAKTEICLFQYIPNRLNQFAVLLLIAFVGYLLGHYVPALSVPNFIYAGLTAAIYLLIGAEIYRRGLFDIHVSAISFVIFAVVLFLSIQYLPIIYSNTNVYPEGLFSIVDSTLISIVFIYSCKYIEKVGILSDILKYMGCNTMIILCFHAIEMSLNLWKYLPEMPFPVWILKVIVLAFIPLIVKKIPVLREVF